MCAGNAVAFSSHLENCYRQLGITIGKLPLLTHFLASVIISALVIVGISQVYASSRLDTGNLILEIIKESLLG